ncbi:MAG: hypothetical protein MMC23_003913 [Stictis urceolatum]|nr:hypothetical protein [Stictis urceolata]
MPLPSPPVKLEGGCSGIYKDTVYTYQSNAFQSLQISQNATWNKLSMGVAVDKAKCVVGAQKGQDALFIVGGTSDDANYSGLQRYTFEDKQWKTIEVPDPNFKGRQQHGAAYLNSTNSILVYAGFQDNLTNSSQTFTISMDSDNPTPQSWTSKAPPVVDPILLPWNTSHAVMAGGSPANQQVWVFSEADGWQGESVVLPQGLPDMSKVQASLIQADNGSKVLELFDMSKSPNKVTSLLVQPGHGKSLLSDQASIMPREPDSFSRKGVDLANWPQYNASDAPTEVREGFSLAQSSSGLVVITGGGSKDSLCIFNQTGNSWLDAEKFFSPATTSTSVPTSAAPTSATTPISSSAVPVAGAQTSGKGTSNARMILGAVLGALFGVAAILIVILLLFRRYKAKKQHQNDRDNDKGNQMNIDDSGVVSAGRGASPDSIDSLKRGYLAKGMISSPQIQDERTSPDRYLTAFPSVFTNSNSNAAEPSRTPREQQGWSSYFNGEARGPTTSNQATGGMIQDNTNSRLTNYTEGSEYTDLSSHPHESAEVPPLNVRSSQQPVQSRYGDDNETFLGTSSSEQDSWSPINTSDVRSEWDRRPVSSIYAESTQFPHPGQRVLLNQFPGVPASNHASIINVPEDEDRGLRTMASRDFGGPSHNAGPVRQVPPYSNNSGSERGVPEDDMSWLNLGAGR